ncbi:MAG: hypothetical protein M5U26_18095 [Planctomycetota bacterium]|nr:hypothetical protein [Planctomycetota bacterium]
MRITEDQFPSGEALNGPDGKPYHRACLPLQRPGEEPGAEPRILTARKRPPSSRRLAAIHAGAAPGRGSGALAPPGSSGRGRAVPPPPQAPDRLPAFVWAAGGFFAGLLLALGYALSAAPAPEAAPEAAPTATRETPPEPRAAGPRAVAFPGVSRALFEAAFDRQDLGGFSAHDFGESATPYAMPDRSRPAGGGMLALAKLENHERFAFGAGAELSAQRLVPERLRLRFRYRLQARRPALCVTIYLEHEGRAERFTFDAADAALNRWRWFDEPLSAFHREALDDGPGQRLVFAAGRGDDKAAAAAYLDDIRLYEPPDAELAPR